MFDAAAPVFARALEVVRAAGTWKDEHILSSPQGPEIIVAGRRFLNFSSNDYLGLSQDSRLTDALIKGIQQWGFGLASVRFISGTQVIHRQLERALAAFFTLDDALLYSSCFDANAGLFEAFLTEEDVVFSDALNHASIIDGIRLCKAERRRFAHADLDDLAGQLGETTGKRLRLIVTDGVFSMDGDSAKLAGLVALADAHGAILMVDDSHGTGVLGETGRGSLEAAGVLGRVDIVTSTFGKALGGTAGGFVVARQPIVDLLRQRSRTSLFSNALAPGLTAAALRALELVPQLAAARARVLFNARRLRAALTDLGFTVLSGQHPIVPVLLGDEHLTTTVARALRDEGLYAVPFTYPVVPRGRARVRLQVSAAHTDAHLDAAIGVWARVMERLQLSVSGSAVGVA